MYFIKFGICTALFCLGVNLYAVEENYKSGARQAGMANTGVTSTEVWANFYNQAGLGYIQSTQIGVFYENRFVVDQLSMQSLSFAFPVKGGTFGMNWTLFGSSAYYESKLALGFGKAFTDAFAAGIQLDLLSVFFDETYPNASAVTMEAGILAQPIKNLYLGVHVFNPIGSSFHSFVDETIPINFTAGLGYWFSEKLFTAAEIEKSSEFPAYFKGGIEYRFYPPLLARIGISSSQMSRYSFGLGFEKKYIQADIAFSHHPYLGFTPHISVNYKFGGVD